ncbi:lipoate--protein ligase B [Arthrobacter sp. UCD-GKA]|jgi:lipoyl(octanoyl) transferase|uniref:lipoyl(octanoyl) transferase LipB n=1 Tax=Arthrobacter sp. UCD-GKA TaxID=1913576 RepID=UPI0008DE535E|nr:lipoyl(octanoyl) transferase LipB [Arthrobacter sp. UCD-GKA]OIH86053.1 lipoate--protein ligase B [Arthrobacter sp. UCD-GKA]
MTIKFERIGHAPELVDYRIAWDMQRRVHHDVTEGVAGPVVFLLEHAAVYTAGRRTEPEDLPVDGTPVIDVDRGGKLTWHGPGQLVGYPIVRLRDMKGIREYVTTLEEALINVALDYGIDAVRIKGRSGVWVAGTNGGQDRKLAAIGIRVDHGVTMHGFALNCSNDLAPYSQIIPCGITDAGVTSISEETGTTVTPADVLDRVEQELETLLSPIVSLTATTPEGARS